MTTVKDTPNPDARSVSPNFITDIVDEDVSTGKVGTVVTRFPPEPNGYAHIGHAFASLINYGIATDYHGQFNLRLDDTNPETEKKEFAEAQIRDLAWLGLAWDGHLYYASDYFGQLYDMAVRLIEEGRAYVDSLSEEDIQSYRGTVTEPGRASPYRERTVQENLDLFTRMNAGEFPKGAHVLRAKIDMASPNMKLRDPLLYRISHAEHYRTGDAWHVYPMYDFAHPLSDALEGVTHSLCSLEFIENRAVYDWLVENLFGKQRPYQYEFGRRSLEYTVVSKRKLAQLIEGGYVSGWDDPRMPTLAGLRRRGVTKEAVRDFVSRIGVSRTNRTVDMALLEYSLRDNLNSQAKRVMAVLEPLKVTLTNYNGEGTLQAPYWPPDVDKEGLRDVPFTRDLYIEREDFEEKPSRGFRRLSPGESVRLRHAYIIHCDETVKNDAGEVTELRCSYLPDSLGATPAGVKVKGAIHWVSAADAVEAEFRLYDRLFTVPDPEDGERDLLEYVNPASLQVRHGFVEPSVRHDPPDTRYQFERQGYFWQDSEDSKPDALVFNRIVTLKDSWSKTESSKTESTPEPVLSAPKAAAKPGEVRDPVLDFSLEQRAKLEQLATLGVAHDDAVLIAENPKLTPFFEEAVRRHDNPQALANWTVNEVRREMSGGDPAELNFSAEDLADLVALVDDGTINLRIAKDVFNEMVVSGKNPRDIIAAQGLEQVTDVSALEPLIDKLLRDNADKVAAYRGGKTGLMGFFVGAAMRETGGRANPQLVKELFTAKLAG
ncbi:glutamine--tRNA ligase/YqeY domain fusion protein [soil metagenome]